MFAVITLIMLIVIVIAVTVVTTVFYGELPLWQEMGLALYMCCSLTEPTQTLCSIPHFVGEETEAQRLSNLPKVT